MAEQPDEVKAMRQGGAEQRKNGQGAADFCRNVGIGVTHFFAWPTKLSEAEVKEGRFVEGRLAAARSDGLAGLAPAGHCPRIITPFLSHRW